MEYTVIVSDKAKKQLAHHIKFIANVDIKSALKTKERLVSAFKSLSKMPQRYPFFEEDFIPRNKYHKMFVENWYLVLYQIKDNTVFVDYVLDCRQEYEWLVK